MKTFLAYAKRRWATVLCLLLALTASLTAACSSFREANTHGPQVEPLVFEAPYDVVYESALEVARRLGRILDEDRGRRRLRVENPIVPTPGARGDIMAVQIQRTSSGAWRVSADVRSSGFGTASNFLERFALDLDEALSEATDRAAARASRSEG